MLQSNLPLPLLYILLIISLSCGNSNSHNKKNKVDFFIVGAMKDAVWKGQLEAKINLDTISNKTGLFGLGPEAYMKGEILVNDGKFYYSRVLSDSTMIVDESSSLSAPFFVYTNNLNWEQIAVPPNCKSIEELEKFIELNAKQLKAPFVFKLIGNVKKAVIHVQNLPEGTKVSSPKDAHIGQVSYKITDANSEVIGFFSKQHQGVFTHHDSFLHMHLISSDKKWMGHVDELNADGMTLYLPTK